MGSSGGMAGGDRPGSAVREHNVRVKIEDNELNDDLPLEGDDDGVDDEVMDRDDVKRNSTAAMDKDKKKHKRGKGSTSRSRPSRA